jgi:hypothetical protein
MSASREKANSPGHSAGGGETLAISVPRTEVSWAGERDGAGVLAVHDVQRGDQLTLVARHPKMFLLLQA